MLLGPVVYPSTVVAKSIGVAKGHMFTPNLAYLVLADTGLPPLHKHLEMIRQDLLMDKRERTTRYEIRATALASFSRIII